MEIKIGKTVVVATLLEGEAPKTCDTIWNVLPFESEAHHAKIAGTELYFVAVPRIVIEVRAMMIPCVIPKVRIMGK